MQAALSSKVCVAARPAQSRAATRRTGAKRMAVQAKYGEESRFFDLQDLENTIGSWDMYGQEDKNRYNSLQLSTFFENAAAGLTRREYVLGLVSIGAAGILAWGAKGSKDVKLPITVGPQQTPVAGPRGRV